jgi:uncharacterized membrane protein YfcA
VPVLHLAAALVGLALVTLGAGGSVVTVPVLIYAGGLPPEGAVATSLVVVGAVAVAGVALRHGAVDWRTGLAVGALGMLGTVPGVWLSHRLPDPALRSGFAGVLLAAAAGMAREVGRAAARPRPRGLAVRAAAGLGVGVAAGLFGVGGGFLVVPALTLLVGLEVGRAVATSLLVIALNSAAALAGHVAYDAVEWRLGATFTLAALAGAAVSVPLGRRLDPRVVRRAFAAVCVVVAAVIAGDGVRGMLAGAS